MWNITELHYKSFNLLNIKIHVVEGLTQVHRKSTAKVINRILEIWLLLLSISSCQCSTCQNPRAPSLQNQWSRVQSKR